MLWPMQASESRRLTSTSCCPSAKSANILDMVIFTKSMCFSTRPVRLCLPGLLGSAPPRTRWMFKRSHHSAISLLARLVPWSQISFFGGPKIPIHVFMIASERCLVV